MAAKALMASLLAARRCPGRCRESDACATRNGRRARRDTCSTQGCRRRTRRVSRRDPDRLVSARDAVDRHETRRDAAEVVEERDRRRRSVRRDHRQGCAFLRVELRILGDLAGETLQPTKASVAGSEGEMAFSIAAMSSVASLTELRQVLPQPVLHVALLADVLHRVLGHAQAVALRERDALVHGGHGEERERAVAHPDLSCFGAAPCSAPISASFSAALRNAASCQ